MHHFTAWIISCISKRRNFRKVLVERDARELPHVSAPRKFHHASCGSTVKYYETTDHSFVAFQSEHKCFRVFFFSRNAFCYSGLSEFWFVSLLAPIKWSRFVIVENGRYGYSEKVTRSTKFWKSKGVLRTAWLVIF